MNKIKRIFFAFWCLLALPQYLAAQVHSTPAVLPVGILSVQMPPLPPIVESSELGGEFVFAHPFYVNIALSDLVPTEKNDTIYYNVSIYSAGAYSLNLIFENVRLVDDCKLSVFGADSADFQEFTIKNVPNTGIVPTNLVRGDSIFVCFSQPKNLAKSCSWTITQVSHDYKNMFSKQLLLKSNEACDRQVDINCEEGNEWQLEKRAVCRMIIRGVTSCTGVLVNNTAYDTIPYLLTANHCVAANSTAERTAFVFNYENATCGNSSSQTATQTVTGAELIATSNKVEFSLLKLSSVPPIEGRPYYVGWNRGETISQGVTCIHHPMGGVKKISHDYDKPTIETFSNGAYTYAYNGHWRIARWDVGTTEGGSSGSPLFNSSHEVVGLLSGGEAGCLNPCNDYFSRLSLAFLHNSNDDENLLKWLDPLNLGVTSCGGFNPYETEERYEIDSLACIPAKGLQEISSGNFTHLAGPNAMKADCFANVIHVNPPQFVRSVSLAVAHVPSGEVQTNVVLWNADFSQELTRKTVQNSDLKPNSWNQIHFDSLLLLSDFAYGVCLDSSNYEQNLSLYQYYDSESNIDGMFRLNETWRAYADFSIPYNIAMQPIVAKSKNHQNDDFDLILRYPISQSKKIDLQTAPRITVFPTICTDYVNIRPQQTLFATAKIRVFDSGGNELANANCSSVGGYFTLQVGHLPTGIFTIVVETPQNIFTEKFIHL